MASPAPRHWSRTLLGFSLLPAISLLSPVLAIPVLVRVGGGAGWAALAIGQALGATAALVVTFGWGSLGPVEVSRLGAAAQAELYWLSAVMRALLLVPAIPASVFLTIVLVSDDYQLMACFACAGIALQGMSPSWFLVGQGRPIALLLFDALPRMLGIVVGLVLAWVWDDLLWFTAVVVLSEGLLAALAWVKLGRRQGGAPVWPVLVERLKQQWPLAASAIVSSGYTRLAVPLVSMIDARAVASFAALDRIQLLGRSGLRPFLNSFQGWVGQGDPQDLPRRAATASVVTLSVGLLGACAVGFLLPVIDGLLFGAQIAITPWQSAMLGLAMFAIAGSSCTALFFLLPAGRVRVVSLSTITASIVGVPLIAWWTDIGGSTGAMSAVAATELVVFAWQAVGSTLAIRQGRERVSQ